MGRGGTMNEKGIVRIGRVLVLAVIVLICGGCQSIPGVEVIDTGGFAVTARDAEELSRLLSEHEGRIDGIVSGLQEAERKVSEAYDGYERLARLLQLYFDAVDAVVEENQRLRNAGGKTEGGSVEGGGE
jgi:hypothetical protein